MVCFLFCRPTLVELDMPFVLRGTVELRVLPCCPVTLWVYSGESCTSCNLFGICIEELASI